MKIIHIESGLGNQMLSYCEYLALKMMNPDDEFYLETIIYDIPECNQLICQWNGYELERIFGIDCPKNIKTLFFQNEWDSMMKEIRDTEFWNHNWNYPVAFTDVFREHGIELDNIRGNFDPNNDIIGTGYQQEMTWKDHMKNTWLWVTLKRYYSEMRESHYIEKENMKETLFLKTDRDVFTGQWLAFKYRGNNRELIDDEIRNVFRFPPFEDVQNKQMADFLCSCNSVAIHARRGDMERGLAWCYNYGYFKRAVNHIRKYVPQPVFVFFTDPGSIEWCKEHGSVFGLDFRKDTVYFVDWNKGTESYRDMQLMSYCKHAIITTSTFGWWGAFFIDNPQKITISPDIAIDTTYHC